MPETKLQNCSLFLEKHVARLNQSLWRYKMPKLQQLFWRKLNIAIRKRFLLNISDLISKFVFSDLKAGFANLFPKRFISILSIYLHHLGSCIRNKASYLTPPPFQKVYTEHYISKFTYYYILFILFHKSCPLDFVLQLHYLAESS